MASLFLPHAAAQFLKNAVPTHAVYNGKASVLLTHNVDRLLHFVLAKLRQKMHDLQDHRVSQASLIAFVCVENTAGSQD